MPNGSRPALPFPPVPKELLPPVPGRLDAPAVPSVAAPALGFAPGWPALPAPLEVPPSLTTGPGPVGAPIGGSRSLSAPQADAAYESVT
jgi:hypothetical protein